MRQYGLIGYPLTGSFSKKYFADKFDRQHIEACVYDNYPLESIDDLPGLLANTPALCGLNVTIPYKKEVTVYLHECSDEVKKMNACNCIRIVNGRLFGYNTDVTGFEMSFTPQLQPHHKKALVLGTGGAAAAVEYVLKKLDIPFSFVSRNGQGNRDATTYAMLNEEMLMEHKIIINTTPLGMSPDIHTAPLLPYQFVTPEHYLYDLVYNPAETLFLKNGLKNGATVKNGADMLIIQAEESWKIWNDATI